MSTLKALNDSKSEGLEKVLHTINHLSSSNIHIRKHHEVSHRQSFTIYDMLSASKIGSITANYQADAITIQSQVHSDIRLYTITEPKDYLKLLFYLSDIK